MADGIPAELMSSLSDRIVSQLGLHFPEDRWNDLRRGIAAAAGEAGYRDLSSYVERLISQNLEKADIATLARHLTVGETYFFRDPAAFQFLEETVLPGIISSRRNGEKRLRIWSAGCCTGEEPYSMAITLGRLIPNLDEWNVTLLATDINQEFLRKASVGIYGKWSFRETPAWIVERYFRPAGKDGRFEILPVYRKVVTFSFQNLADDKYPSLLTNTNAMDIIVCRNVLMYFERRLALRIIENLYNSLVEGGWLLVSPTELFQLQDSKFLPIAHPGGVFYLKDSKRRTAVRNALSVPDDEEAWARVREVAPQEMEPQVELAHEEFVEGMPTPSPDSPETLYESALHACTRGKYAEAKEGLLRLLSKFPDHAVSLALLARIYANEGNLPAAVEACAKAIAAEKLNPEFHYLLASILLEKGSFDEAAKSLKTALYIDPGFILAHFALGNLTRQRGGSEESLKHFRNALSILEGCGSEDPVLAAEGMTAGRIMEIIKSILEVEQVS